jgi:hypothetical protein
MDHVVRTLRFRRSRAPPRHWPDRDDRLAITAELIALASAINDRQLHLHGLHWRAVDLFEAGDTDGFRDTVEEHVDLADKLALPAYQWYGPDATLAGRYDEGERLGDEALVLGRRARDPNAELFRKCSPNTPSSSTRPSTHSTSTSCGHGAPRPPPPNAWRCALAWILAETGNKQAARRELNLRADAGFASAPRDPDWLVFIAECGETCPLLGWIPARARTQDQSLRKAKDPRFATSRASAIGRSRKPTAAAAPCSNGLHPAAPSDPHAAGL